MLRDTQGKEITVGSKVAYNLSGNVALGVVEKINDGILNESTSWPSYDVKPVIYIRPYPAFAKNASQTGLSKMVIYHPIVDKVVVLDG